MNGKSSLSQKAFSDADLDRLATEEILRDTQKAASRAESFGSTAWKPSPIAKPNKLFLTRAIGGIVIQNAWMDANRVNRPSSTRSGQESQSSKEIRNSPTGSARNNSPSSKRTKDGDFLDTFHEKRGGRKDLLAEKDRSKGIYTKTRKPEIPENPANGRKRGSRSPSDLRMKYSRDRRRSESHSDDEAGATTQDKNYRGRDLR